MKKICKFIISNSLIIFLDIFFTLLIISILLLMPIRLIRKYVLKSFRSVWSGTPIFYLAFCAAAEKKLGINSISLVISNYYIADHYDYNLSKWCPSWLPSGFLAGPVFVWACIFSDRLHFYCDRGFCSPLTPFRFNRLEIITYKIIGIEVFLWTYGGDVRCRGITKSLGEPNCCTDCEMPMVACICDDTLQKRQMNFLSRNVKAICSMGDMIEYTPGSYNNLWFWPINFDNPKYEPNYPNPNSSEPLRIVHAPNHRMFKGTRFLISAVDELRQQGVEIDLILVEKVPNEEALDIYRSADVIFDQCMIGWHGYFALEAMALGKPVLCFIRKPDIYLCAPDECPIVKINYNNIAEALLKIHNDRCLAYNLGVSGRNYVCKHFSIPAFASRLDAFYKHLNSISK